MIIPEKITEITRVLRKSMTPAEKILWQKLRARKLRVKFLRQHPINLMQEDNFHARCIIADFYCHEYKLIIELDGSIHDIPEILELDREKEVLLESQGFRVLRFRNEEIIGNISQVLKSIQSKYIV